MSNFEFYQLKSSILIEEYKILIDFLKYHHARRQNFETIFLAVDTILVSASAYILGVSSSETRLFLIPLCIIGIVASMVWLSVSERINIDADLKCFQLRCIERDLNRTGGIFISGYDFFSNRRALKSPDRKDIIEFPKGIIGLLSRFRGIWVDRVLPLIFICLYICLMIYSIS